jgi:hypothetical protein
MNVKFKATKIKWNVDKEDIEEGSSLPNEIDVPEEIVKEAMNKIFLEMSDYISDETGFCHNGFALKCCLRTKEEFV